MTRRALLALPVALLATVPDTPRNRLCNSANAFNAQFSAWADRMNEHVGTVHAPAVEAWEPLPGLWRRVEHAWREWLRA